ncbi:MAG: PIG-L family deacetylase, partial [Candidatus Omnitrophica bacterium]|nr:PIG-L family deacetylase [Candidatus Omnitrophota bacterium]
DKKRDINKRKKQIEQLQEQALKANKILGIRDVYFFNFPDNRFDTVAILDIIKAIEEVKNKIKPDTIFTHHRNDLNVDHIIIYQAVITACRPLENETVREIYSCEILSSTEWNYPNIFCPNVYVDISKTINKKIEAMEIYKNELQKWPHPRSLVAIEILAKKRGCEVGLEYAEAFELVKKICL